MAITQRFATEGYVNTRITSKADVTTLDNYYLTSEANTLHTEILEYVDDEVAALVNSAPETLDTLGELAIAFEENQDMVETLNAAVTNKAEKSDLENAQKSIDTNTNSINSIQTQLNGILELVYPKGAIYISTIATNPSVLFGFGEWEKINDTFLLASGDIYEAGCVGGESEHTLSKNEMPSVIGEIVTHGVYSGTPIAAVTGCFSVKNTVSGKYLGGSTSGADSISNIKFDNGGNGQPHNNMPPYLAVYMWKRIA